MVARIRFKTPFYGTISTVLHYKGGYRTCTVYGNGKPAVNFVIDFYDCVVRSRDTPRGTQYSTIISVDFPWPGKHNYFLKYLLRCSSSHQKQGVNEPAKCSNYRYRYGVFTHEYGKVPPCPVGMVFDGEYCVCPPPMVPETDAYGCRCPDAPWRTATDGTCICQFPALITDDGSCTCEADSGQVELTEDGCECQCVMGDCCLDDDDVDGDGVTEVICRCDDGFAGPVCDEEEEEQIGLCFRRRQPPPTWCSTKWSNYLLNYIIAFLL